MKIPEVNLNMSPIDRIVNLLSLGFNSELIYKDILKHCGLSVKTNNEKQQLANLIAQIKYRNVFAKGKVPK